MDLATEIFNIIKGSGQTSSYLQLVAKRQRTQMKQQDFMLMIMI